MQDCELWQYLTVEARNYLRQNGVPNGDTCKLCQNEKCVNVVKEVYDYYDDPHWSGGVNLHMYEMKDGTCVQEVYQSGVDLLFHLSLRKPDGTVFCKWPEEE